MTEPTDAEIRGLAATGNGVYQDDETAIWEITDPSLMKFARAVLAKWGQPAVKGDPVAWLSPWRKDQVTTDYDAYGKHGIPLYAAPQPVAREPLTDEQIQDLLLCGNPTYEEMRLIRIGWDAANGIKGGQHGTE